MNGVSWDLGLGGREFDALLREHFASEFKQRYKVDARTAKRPWLRLLDECSKLKKQMSDNSTAIPINIECFMDDKDVTASMQRYVVHVFETKDRLSRHRRACSTDSFSRICFWSRSL